MRVFNRAIPRTRAAASARPWFRAAVTDDTFDLHIDTFIGDWYDDAINRWYGEEYGITAKAVVDKLAALPDSVTKIVVHINSPGGDVFGALNIANALRAQADRGRSVTSSVEGLAASAATIIMMAGSVIRIADNALVMIHNPWSVAIGEASDFRAAADELDKVRDSIVRTYQWHSPLDEAALVALMDATTWMSAAEALEAGLVTEVVSGQSVAACAGLTRDVLEAMAAPADYAARLAALQPPAAAEGEPVAEGQAETPPAEGEPAPAVENRVETPPTGETARVPVAALEVLRACREAGTSQIAEALVEAGVTAEELAAGIAAERDRQTAEASRVTGIRSVCTSANLASLADSYIAGGVDLETVRAQVLIISARVDELTTIDGALSPDAEPRRIGGARRELNPAAIYQARRAAGSK